ncbi:MAG: hypothetical protein HN368_03435 [Spirochaetales bacterium]|jgi:hypothetical protein|nr:hypothetical protein [Spirochaetales bacterium]
MTKSKSRGQYFLPACGLLTLVAVALQPEMYVRCAQMIFFMMLAGTSGKRIRILPPLLLMAGVVLANLLVPNGRVLLIIGRMKITGGALENGISKGSLLIGLIYVSRISIGRGVALPGVFGGLLFRSFSYFEALTEGFRNSSGRAGRERLRIKGLLNHLDTLLLELDESAGSFQEKNQTAAAAPVDRRKLVTGIFLLTAGWIPYAVVLIFW